MKTNLKRIRESQHKRQEDVAVDLAMSLSTYRSWEQGKRKLNGEKLSMLADYYHVSVDEIIGVDTAENSHQRDVFQSENETEILSAFRMLNSVGQNRLLEIADDMVRSGKYEKKEGKNHSAEVA